MTQLRAVAHRRVRATAYAALDAAFLGRGVPRTVNGERVRFPATWSRYYPAVYERAKHDFLLRHCKPGTTVIDGGAHIGLFTVVMAHAVGPDGWVLAFEPTPATRAVLAKTIAMNDLGATVCARPEGLSRSTGRRMLHIGTTEGSNSNSIVAAPVAMSSTPRSVSTLALDDLLPFLPSAVSCVKMDIEGAELDALLGATAMLEQQRPALCVEVHPPMLRAAGQDPVQMWDLLMDVGYRLHEGMLDCTRERFEGDDFFEFQAR